MEEDIRQMFEEYQRLLAQAGQEQKLLGDVSESTKKSLALLRSEITRDSQAFQGLTQSVNKASRATQAFQSVKKSAQQTAGSFKALSGSLAAGATSFASFTAAARGVTDSFGVLGRTAGEAFGFVLSRADELARSYNELATVGAITARGVDGLRESFDQLGLIGLPEFGEAVRRNSVAMVALGSTTSRGAVQVGKALGQLTNREGPFVGPLLNLGFTLQEISAYGTDYVGMLALSGNRNIQTTEQVTEAMVGYLRQIDEVARATGKSREQINEETKKQQADVRFRAKLMELEATGRGEEAKALRQYAQYAAGPLADAIRASVSGVPLTKDAAAAVALFGGAIQQQLFAIKNGATGQQAFTATMASASENATKFNKTMQYGAEALGSEGLQGQFLDMAEIYRRAAREGLDPLTLAEQERKRLEAAGGATKGLADAQIGIASAARGLQALGFDLLPLATTAVQGFTTAINLATNTIRAVIGNKGVVSEPRPGVTPGVNPGQAAAGATSRSYLDKIKQLESGGRNIQNQTGSSAFGLYQMMPDTYAGLAMKARPGSPLYGTTFEQMKGDVNLQEAAMAALTQENAANLARRNINPTDAAKYMAHVLGVNKAANIILAPPDSSLDNFLGGNAARIREQNPTLFGADVRTTGDLKKKFEAITGSAGYQFGGIARGPKSGYMSVLHGTEAVVPLPDGRTIPVSMPNDLTSGIREQVSLLSAQLSKMDEMIGAMRAQTAMSQKILQHSTS